MEMDAFSADAVCMLAPLSAAAHESRGLFESAGSMGLLVLQNCSSNG